MTERGGSNCPHSKYSIDEIETTNKINYIRDLVSGDDFPGIVPGVCTLECKEKMKEIVEKLFEYFKRNLLNYYDDCKILFNKELTNCQIGFESYLGSLEFNEYDSEIELYTNLQYVNGKVVRFCDLPKENKEEDEEKEN